MLHGDNTVVVNGKNLFNANATYYSRGDYGTITISGNNISIQNTNNITHQFVWWNVPITSGNSITMSYDKLTESTTDNNNALCYAFSSTPYTTFVGFNDFTKINKTNKYATASATDNYLVIGLRAAPNCTITIEKIQVEIGSTATTYERYIEPQTQLLSLGDIELAKIGNYTDRIFKDSGKWYVEKNIGKDVLDGSNDETLTIDAVAEGTSYRSFNFESEGYTLKNSVCICNKLAYSTESIYTNDIQGIKPNSIGQIKMKILDSSLTSVAALRTWLTSNNLTIYDIRPTPTYTEITDTTLLAQLENVLKMHTNKNVTNISIVPTGTNAEPTAEVEYRVDLGTVIGNINNAIISLGGNV